MGSSSAFGPLGPIGHPNDIASAQVDTKALTDAVAKINAASAVGPDNEIVVTISGHRMAIQIVDRETLQIVEQISPPSVFRILRKLSAV